MTPDPYRKAYDKAIEDLTSISQTFERLSTRKKQVENAIAALQPIFAPMEHATQEIPSHAPIETPRVAQEASTEAESEPAGGYSFLDVPAPLPTGSDGDPFQRRVRAGNFRFKGLAAQRSF